MHPRKRRCEWRMPYRCVDKVMVHKEALFAFLTGRWEDHVGVTYDVLRYDLTSTYVESDPPVEGDDKYRHGQSRDHCPDRDTGGLPPRVRGPAGQPAGQYHAAGLPCPGRSTLPAGASALDDGPRHPDRGAPAPPCARSWRRSPRSRCSMYTAHNRQPGVGFHAHHATRGRPATFAG